MTLKLIDKYSKAEWRAIYLEKWQAARTFAQQKGEMAALVCFVLGALLILFYKLALVIVSVALLVALIIQVTAREI